MNEFVEIKRKQSERISELFRRKDELEEMDSSLVYGEEKQE